MGLAVIGVALIAALLAKLVMTRQPCRLCAKQTLQLLLLWRRLLDLRTRCYILGRWRLRSHVTEHNCYGRSTLLMHTARKNCTAYLYLSVGSSRHCGPCTGLHGLHFVKWHTREGMQVTNNWCSTCCSILQVATRLQKPDGQGCARRTLCCKSSCCDVPQVMMACRLLTRSSSGIPAP